MPLIASSKLALAAVNDPIKLLYTETVVPPVMLIPYTPPETKAAVFESP